MPASSLLAGGMAILNTGRVSLKLPDDPLPWHCLDKEYVFRRPPWLVLRHQRFRLPTGREIADYWISEFPPWVNVVAVTGDGRFVFVRQYRPGIGAVHYELPAGVVEEGETLLAAAQRELMEETGFARGRWSVLARLSANPALQDNMTTTFLAEGVEHTHDATPELTEDLRVHLVKVGDAVSLLDNGDMIQALHAAPLLRYLLEH
jgi:8-oxo-dGTP pyrophosphatase MutT (NUDIX family)